jgi:hypothetical protein
MQTILLSLRAFLTFGLAVVPLAIPVTVLAGKAPPPLPGFTADWATQAGGPAADSGYGVAVDPSGSSYVIGNWGGSEADPKPGTGNAALLAKYDPDGVCRGFRVIGSSSASTLLNGIALDAQNRCYLIGWSSGSGTYVGRFNSGTLESDPFFETPPSGYVGCGSRGIAVGADGVFITGGCKIGNNGEISVAKLNLDGTIAWIRDAGDKSFGTSWADLGNAVAADNAGGCYVTGQFYEANALFGDIPLHGTDDDSAFIARYDCDGQVQWARRIGGTRASRGRSIAVDHEGGTQESVYVSGQVTGDDIVFDEMHILASGGPVFLAKYSPDGECLWARTGDSHFWGNAAGVSVDAQHQVFIGGWFGRSMSFKTPVGTYSLKGVGGYDVFVAKYDPTGNLLGLQRFGGDQHDNANGIAAFGDGNCAVTGNFLDNISFGGATLRLNSYGDADVFVTQLHLR